MSSITNLHQLFQSNERDRIAKEQKAIERIVDPALPRHTIYKGDRTIQQLGDQPIENGIVLNNQSLAIGDVMLPLAKGNVLRRIDSTNGGALLGTAYRDAVEKDFDANGNRRSTVLSRNGGNEPSDPTNPNDQNIITILGINPDRVPPPFGCTPPPSKCIWSSNPIAPNGFQNHGDAVVNENALPVYLHCVAGTSVPSNLNCGFLDPQNWSCLGGICSPNPSGIYTSQAQCEAALIPPPFTGGQSSGIQYDVFGQFYSSTGEPYPGFTYKGMTNLRQIRTYGKIGGLRKKIITPETPTQDALIGWVIDRELGEIDILYGVGDDQARTGSIVLIERVDGLPDTDGNLPSTCPI